ncbi:HTTM domain-containing protein [Flavobacterium sp. MAH-1]|uniref:HTTM domain-containing protein n=1 Tax=Flavobacterium agri TaxID=2743471 RepID=A0A7Y8Y542_9FLAO|nr:HTTM domain-containing protein [Flavobacterium agri]NUY82049.1 HTTM domain-containing protein [Flavobacterium agri]NYA72073.1 HTTM domain-containing protein [Flavobacterium agri]
MAISIRKYLASGCDAATLAFFRLAFGFMMLGGLIRFAAYGWIEKFYIKPVFHFTYYGFEWVKPLGDWTYLLFAVCAVSAFMVAIGFKYRLAIVTFFLTFTYIELMDKTTYLNHYYFVSVVSFIMIFLPANAFFSVDAHRNQKLAFSRIPRWTTDILKLLLGIVYFYAGLAKLNSDWLLHAMPLKIWLPGNMDLPLIGTWLNQNWMQYAFCWIGAAYDLTIPFLLLNRKTRFWAFLLVIVFHILTKILFPIGIFPYIMIVATLIFFGPSFHRGVLGYIRSIFRLPHSLLIMTKEKVQTFDLPNVMKLNIVIAFVVFQLFFPFRYLLYPDELFWTEEGFRFSWRVMLMEKAGYTEFRVVDEARNAVVHVDNHEFLTAFQEKQMAFQPDFILEYAHFLHDEFEKRGIQDPKVFCTSYVALNGRLSQPYIDPKVDLSKQYESFRHKTWILLFNDEIYGF